MTERELNIEENYTTGEIHNLQVSSYIVKIMKSKRLGHVMCLIEHVHTFENEHPRERGLLIDRGAYGRTILKCNLRVQQ
jgi:hypothetical protein